MANAHFKVKVRFTLVFLFFTSAVKLFITINLIQNKIFDLHIICVFAVCIYNVYINTNTCMYIFKKICYIYIYIYKYTQYTHIYCVNIFFYFGCNESQLII